MVLVEALREPIETPPEASETAEQAVIFYPLGPGAEPSILEVVAHVQSLEKAGRLLGQYAIDGGIEITFSPDQEAA